MKYFNKLKMCSFVSIIFAAQAANAVTLKWSPESNAVSAAITSSNGMHYVLSPHNPVVDIPGKDDVTILPTFAAGQAHQPQNLMLTVSGVYFIKITGNQNNYAIHEIKATDDV